MHRPPGSTKPQAGRDVDPVAEQVAVVGNHVAEVDPDPEADAPVVRRRRVAVEHAPLHLDGTAHRLDRARELDQETVAGGLDDAAAMLADLGVTSSRRCALRRARVPSSSWPMRRL
jgi:hypothetical protein